MHTGLRPSTQTDLLALLDSILRDVNPFAQVYKMLKEFEEETMLEVGEETASKICMHKNSDRILPGEYRGRYNALKENEIAAVFKSSDGVLPSNRDIVDSST